MKKFSVLIYCVLVYMMAVGTGWTASEQRKVSRQDIEWSNDVDNTVTSTGLHVGNPLDTAYSFSAPYIDVRAYGAVGDGVTDDAPAFIAAYNAAVAAGGAGVVRIPTPSVYYRFDTAGPTISTNNIVFKGDTYETPNIGASFRKRARIVVAANSIAAFEVSSASASVYNVSFSGFSIGTSEAAGNPNNTTNRYGIKLTSSASYGIRHIVIDKVGFDGLNYGVHGSGATEIHQVSLNDSPMSQIGIGVYMGGPNKTAWASRNCSIGPYGNTARSHHSYQINGTGYLSVYDGGTGSSNPSAAEHGNSFDVTDAGGSFELTLVNHITEGVDNAIVFHNTASSYITKLNIIGGGYDDIVLHGSVITHLQNPWINGNFTFASDMAAGGRTYGVATFAAGKGFVWEGAEATGKCFNYVQWYTAADDSGTPTVANSWGKKEFLNCAGDASPKWSAGKALTTSYDNIITYSTRPEGMYRVDLHHYSTDSTNVSCQVIYPDSGGTTRTLSIQDNVAITAGTQAVASTTVWSARYVGTVPLQVQCNADNNSMVTTTGVVTLLTPRYAN